MRVLPLGLGLLLLAPVSAQQTYVVDINQGPGSQFAQIDQAVAAADPGDTILVRPGSYFPFDISEGISILGEDGVFVPGGFHVSGVPVGLPAVLRNMTVQFAHPAILKGYRATANAGTVIFDRVHSQSVEVDISNSALVTFSGCNLTGSANPVKIDTSTAHMDSCTVAGDASFAISPSVLCTSSTVHVGATTIRGGDQFFFPATQAIQLDSGTLVLGEGCTVEAGTTNEPLTAIVTNGGEIIMDLATPIVPRGGAPAITGPATVQETVVPAVRCDGAVVGGSLDGATLAPSFSLALTFLGFPRMPLATPVGDLWVLQPVIFDSGTVPGSGVRSYSVPIPAGIPAGLPITVQTAAIVFNRAYFSTPATCALGQ